MSLNQNMNQFAPTPGLGQPMKGVQPATLNVRINPASSGTGMQVASPFSLFADTATGEIVVDLATSSSVIFGVVPANTKKPTYAAGDVLDLFCEGNTLLLESVGAINAGDLLALGNTSAVGGGPGATTTTTVGAQYGAIALTSVTASQKAVLVKIKAGVVAPAPLATSSGTITLSSGAASMTGLVLTAASQLEFTLKTPSGTIAGLPYLTAISTGSGTATVAAGGSDNSTYNWRITG